MQPIAIMSPNLKKIMSSLKIQVATDQTTVHPKVFLFVRPQPETLECDVEDDASLSRQDQLKKALTLSSFYTKLSAFLSL